MSFPSRAFVLLFFATLLLSCGGGDEDGAGVPDIQIEGGWARAMPLLGGDTTGNTNSAVYLRIRNTGSGADRLLGGQTPSAEVVEIHQSVVVDDVMRMRKLNGMEILPHDLVALEPGGVHLMLLGLTQPLSEGEEIELILRFERSGEVVVPIPIRPVGGA